MTTWNATDRLMEESRRLRESLSRLAARVEAFSDELREETRDLKERSGETEIVERSPDADRGDTPGSAGQA
jgi:hypothetical protein